MNLINQYPIDDVQVVAADKVRCKVILPFGISVDAVIQIDGVGNLPNDGYGEPYEVTKNWFYGRNTQHVRLLLTDDLDRTGDFFHEGQKLSSVLIAKGWRA